MSKSRQYEVRPEAVTEAVKELTPEEEITILAGKIAEKLGADNKTVQSPGLACLSFKQENEHVDKKTGKVIPHKIKVLITVPGTGKQISIDDQRDLSLIQMLNDQPQIMPLIIKASKGLFKLKGDQTVVTGNLISGSELL